MHNNVKFIVHCTKVSNMAIPALAHRIGEVPDRFGTEPGKE